MMLLIIKEYTEQAHWISNAQLSKKKLTHVKVNRLQIKREFDLMKTRILIVQ